MHGSNKFRSSSIVKCVIPLLLSLIMLSATPAMAQAEIMFANTDIGSPGLAGNYLYSSGTYTLKGSGAGVTGSSDSFCFASTGVTGNIEMVAKVATLAYESGTGTISPYATAGLMIRAVPTPTSGGVASSPMAYVSVSPQNGVNFTARTTAGGNASTTLGASISVPVWLKLVVSQSTIASYRSSDGLTWTQVGRTTMTMPAIFQAGLAVSSNDNAQRDVATFTDVSMLTNVPQRSADMLLWQRADMGVTTSGAAVTSWADQSASGNTGVQATGANRPTFATNQINGLPAVVFAAGSSQFLRLPAGFADLSGGASIVAVFKPTALPVTGIIDIGNGGTSNNIRLLQQGSPAVSAQFLTYQGTSGTAITTPAATLPINQTHIVTAIQGGGAGSISIDGVQQVSGTLLNMNNITRSTNYIGQYTGGGFYYTGQLVEILFFKKTLSLSERLSLEAYLTGKYAVGGTPPTLAAPAISPQYASVGSQQTVTITPPPGALVYYTLNGGTATLYTGPFSVTSTTNISATASQPGFQTSTAATGTIEVDPAGASVTQPGPALWYRADLGAPPSGDVSTWYDISGNQLNATQTGTRRPTITSGPNSLPALDFDSTKFQNLQIPTSSLFSNLSQGASVFLVTKPATQSASNYRMFWLGPSASTTNQIAVDQLSTSSWASYSSVSAVTASGLSTSAFQVLGTVYNGATTTTLFNNSAPVGTSAFMTTAGNVSRIGTIGAFSNGTSVFYKGVIAEIIFYPKALTSSQRLAVEGYLAHKYALYVNTPVITPPTGVYPIAPQILTIAADTGSTVRYTLDGTTPAFSPSPHGTVYDPLNPPKISTTSEVKAIAHQSFADSAVTNSSWLVVDPLTQHVPRTGLVGWYMGSVAATVSGGNFSWMDLSGSGNNASSSGTAAPSILTNAVNSYSVVASKDGTPTLNYASLPTGYTSLNGGVSLFGVVGDNSASNYSIQQIARLGNASTDAVTLTGSNFSSQVGASTQSLSFPTSSPNLFHSYLGIQKGNATGQTNLDGALANPSALQNPNNISRTVNTIAKGGLYAEVLVYNRALTGDESEDLAAYASQKYDLPLGPPVPPTFSVANGTTLLSPSQIQITAGLGQEIRFTVNGSTPSVSSPLYSQPVPVLFTQTIKAIAVSNGVTSAVSTATYTLDATQWPAAPVSDSTAPKINIQVPTPAQ